MAIYTILDATAPDKITVSGNNVFKFPGGLIFTVYGSPGGVNDGQFTVVSAALVGVDTEITVVEPVTTTVSPHGYVQAFFVNQPYDIYLSDLALPALTTISPGTLDTGSSSLHLPGSGYGNWGDEVLNDLIWMTENYANTNPGGDVNAPANPLTGQLYYDKTNQELKIYDGSWGLVNVGALGSTYVAKAGDTMTGALTITPGVSNGLSLNNTGVVYMTFDNASDVWTVGVDGSSNFYIETGAQAAISIDTSHTIEIFGAVDFTSTGNITATNDLQLGAGGADTVYLKASGAVSLGADLDNYRLNIHEPSSSHSYARFSNTTTNTSGTDGFLVGLSSAEEASLFNYENTDMVFYNNATQAMRLKASGNLSIGADLDNYKLNVYDGTNALAHFTTTASGTTGSDGLIVGMINGVGYVRNGEAEDLRLGANAIDVLTIDGASTSAQPRVGVGISTPVAAMHLHTSTGPALYLTSTTYPSGVSVALGGLTGADLALGNFSGGNIDIVNKRVMRVSTPTQTTDAANKSYVDATVATPPSGISIPYGSQITLQTSHNDAGAIYKYEPAADESHTRIELSDNPLSGVDKLDIGADSGSWSSAVSIGADGNVTWRDDSPWSLMPVGGIIMWPTNAAPSGFLECAGQFLITSSYPNLFAVIGYTYGGSGGSFRMPDLRGEFVRGWDHGRTADPDRLTRTDRGDGTAGDNVGTKQQDEFESHTHTANTGSGAGAHDYIFPDGDGNPTFAQALNAPAISNTGGNETRPRNVYMMYIIKY